MIKLLAIKVPPPSYVLPRSAGALFPIRQSKLVRNRGGVSGEAVETACG
jgi:hypothetical protein